MLEERIIRPGQPVPVGGGDGGDALDDFDANDASIVADGAAPSALAIRPSP